MRALLLTLSLISVSLIVSYTVLPNYIPFEPTLKIILKSYFVFWDFTNDDDQQPSTDSNDLLRVRCNTWQVVNDLMLSIMDDLKRMTYDLANYSEQLVQVFDNYLYNVKVQVDEFQNRLNKLNQKVMENPGPAGQIIKAIHQQLEYIHNDICNSTKMVMSKVNSENSEAAATLKDFILHILNTAYRTVINYSLYEPEIMECVCNVLLDADKLYAKQYPNLRDCVVEFDYETEKIFNNTKYSFFTLKEMTGDDVINSVSKSSLVDVMMYLPVKVRIHLFD